MAFKMPEKINQEFDEPSLELVWDILRQTAIPRLVGRDLCPVPYVDRPQYFDMFNVYTKKTKKISEKLKRFAGKKSKFAFIGKLGDVLEIPSRKDEETLAMATAIGQDKYHQEIPDFAYSMRSEDRQKEISVRIQGAKNFVSNTTFTMSKAYVNVRRYPMFVTSLYSITNVCAADTISIEFRWRQKGIRSIQDWKIKGPAPIAIKLTKFEVRNDGRIGGQESVPCQDILDVHRWKSDSFLRPFLSGCESLRLYLHGRRSDATRRSRSLHRMHLSSSRDDSSSKNGRRSSETGDRDGTTSTVWEETEDS